MKKRIVIIGFIIALFVIGIIVFLTLFKDNFKKDDSKNENKVSEQEKIEDKLIAPADNTTDLTNKLSKIEVESITTDEIVFNSEIELNEGERVAIWLYSKPKFLGYFEIIIKDDIKKIEGLTKALENITVEKGKHNIAIVTENGKEVGYIDIYLNDTGFNKNEIKEVTETETIDFKTTKKEETNMKSGTKEIVQQGQKGEKTVTYNITYDTSGKEISREKISEKITKEAINQVEKVGISDFNLNTDNILCYINLDSLCFLLLTH